MGTRPALAVRVVSVLLRNLQDEVTGPVSRFAERKAVPAAVPSRAEAAVLRAVTYASLFQYPLTPAETRRTLVGCRLSETGLMALYRSSAFLQARLDYRGGFFVPAGRESWVHERAAREARSLRLIDEHRRFLNVLSAIPYVRLLAISGSLAHLNATRHADLDLFVITRGPRVWSITTVIVLAAKLMGCRRTVCANFVVSDRDLAVGPPDEFSANQIIHLCPIVGAEAHREFLDANPFVQATYPNFDSREKRAWPFTPAPWAGRIKRVLEWAFAIPSSAVEAICRAAYGWYLRRKVRHWASPDQVRLTNTHLKLHGNSHRQAIKERFAVAVRRAVLSQKAGS